MWVVGKEEIMRADMDQPDLVRVQVAQQTLMVDMPATAEEAVLVRMQL
jgi:hypothetical protein